MAEADLDVVIRNLAKQQYKALMAAAKKRHADQSARAAKAKDKDAKAQQKAMAKNTLLLATATANRLQISAANAADSYARAVKKAAEEAAAMKPAKPAKKAEPKKAATKPKAKKQA